MNTYSYLTDSLVNRIYAYDYNDGELSNRRVFVDPLAQGLPEGTFPDGLCFDSEGGIWSARFVTTSLIHFSLAHHRFRWGGSKIVRHAKDGSIDFEVFFPTALNITACCFGGEMMQFTSGRSFSCISFGGPNNDQLFVTTAHCGAIGGDSSRQEQYPNSGDIFQVDLSDRYKGGKWRHNFSG